MKALDFTSIKKQILERGTLSRRESGFNGGYVRVCTRKTHRSTFSWRPCDRKNTPVVLFPRYLKYICAVKCTFKSCQSPTFIHLEQLEVYFDYIQSNILHLIVLLTCFVKIQKVMLHESRVEFFFFFIHDLMLKLPPEHWSSPRWTLIHVDKIKHN